MITGRLAEVVEQIKKHEGTGTPMPAYTCHKEVWALKIKEIVSVGLDHTSLLGGWETEDFGAVIVPEGMFGPFTVSRDWLEKHQPKVGGYFVSYLDGYTSFSPGKAFEEGYSPREDVRIKARIGEEGTEQFTVETRVNGDLIRNQPIHDPFIRSRVTHTWNRWHCFLGLFNSARRQVVVQVQVDGSEGANRAIMTMDPVALQEDTKQILLARADRRSSGSMTSVFGETLQSKP